MYEFLEKIDEWENRFHKGCRVVIWSDGSGHVEIKLKTNAKKWHEVYAFEEPTDFLRSNPLEMFPERMTK